MTIEMFVCSIMVFFAFSYKPFVHRPPDGDVPFVSTFMKAFRETESERASPITVGEVTPLPPYNKGEESEAGGGLTIGNNGIESADEVLCTSYIKRDSNEEGGTPGDM